MARLIWRGDEAKEGGGANSQQPLARGGASSTRARLLGRRSSAHAPTSREAAATEAAATTWLGVLWFGFAAAAASSRTLPASENKPAAAYKGRRAGLFAAPLGPVALFKLAAAAT